MYVYFIFWNTPPTCNHHNRHSIFFLDVALCSGVTQVGIRNSLRSNNMYQVYVLYTTLDINVMKVHL